MGWARIKAAIRGLWAGLFGRSRQDAPPRSPAEASSPLSKCWDHVSRLAGSRDDSQMPAPVNLDAFNCRVRIGRQADGDSWLSVVVLDICGTIQAPADGHEVELRVAMEDITDGAREPLPILHRPKHGPLNPSAHFTFQADMGKLCRQVTVLEDWTTAAQISPEWFILPRTGTRTIGYRVCVVSRQTGEQLACVECTGTYENTETGYLDIEDNIQRAKTLAVGLAFSVAAANGQLLDPELGVIQAWVQTNFGSAGASDDVKLELERALHKTAGFFRTGGTLDIPEICREIVEIAPLIGRVEFLNLCLRVAAVKGQVTQAEIKLLKDLSDWLQVDRARLRAMVEKILPVEMHENQDAEVILGVTADMSKDEARVQLNREYAKWSSRVISTDPSVRRQADQMLKLLGEARMQYVGAKSSP